ncbi:hypothetical protein [Gordonia sp. VNK21]|uniref:hypothetical protein n=1 Tax=Gordonia sp. VNK21 TaxID=3382483 RepID=UPI0038D3B8E2
MSNIDDAARLSAFVRRLRRVEAHPLIAMDGGERIRELCKTQFKTEVYPETGEVVLKFDLPDEVQFESLAARLRPMTLDRDTLGHSKVMDSLDALTDTADETIARSSAHFRTEWRQATERDRARGAKTRAYSMVVQNIETGEIGQATDLDLAYAWLYEDSIHGDLPSYDEFDARDRYRAATHVFSHIAVVALETLAYIRFLVERGHLAIPAEGLEVDVVVNETRWEQRGRGFFGEPGRIPEGTDLTDEVPPPGMRPICEILEVSADRDSVHG